MHNLTRRPTLRTLRRLLPRAGFLLAGAALAALIANGFLWYAAGQAPNAPFLPVLHETCGEPVALRVEDYNLWGGTRPGDDIELARVDYCDPVRVLRREGGQEVWLWMAVESTGQVYPYAGWGFPWADLQTPFPADDREPRNPWWAPRSTIRAVAHDRGYPGGDGGHCPLEDASARGLDLFFYRDAGFQLPVGMQHSGWVCLYFDEGRTLPDAFTLTLRPDRARITQWVDKALFTRALPTISDFELCDYARATHPATIRSGGPCAG